MGTVVTKSSNESRASTTALSADSALVVSLATGIRFVQCTVYLSTANATMDFKFATGFTGTATVVAWYRRYSPAGATLGTDNENTLAGSGAQIASTAVAATTSGIARVDIEMLLDVTVSGTWQFQWAQNTSDAGQLTVLRGSNIYVA